MSELGLVERRARFEAAVADLERFRREWVELGCPSLSSGVRDQEVAHPYVKMIRDAERACELLSGEQRKAVMGRPPGASSAPDRVGDGGQPVRVKLKAV